MNAALLTPAHDYTKGVCSPRVAALKLSGKIKAHSREIFGFGDIRKPSTHYINRHPNPEHSQDMYFMCVEFRDHEREEWEEGVGVRVRAGVGSGVGVGAGGGVRAGVGSGVGVGVGGGKGGRV